MSTVKATISRTTTIECGEKICKSCRYSVRHHNPRVGFEDKWCSFYEGVLDEDENGSPIRFPICLTGEQ